MELYRNRSCWVIAAATAADPVGGRGKAKPIPQFSEIRQVVLRYFQARADYRPGDLITREEVEPLLGRIERMGLPLPDAKRILENVPAKDSFLSQQLGTPEGRKFMRQIAGYPNGYDRVDRLSRLPRGQQTVRDLIKGPGGEKMIEYMTTAAGGKELGKMLSSDPPAPISTPLPGESTRRTCCWHDCRRVTPRR